MWGSIQRTVLEGLAVFTGIKRSRLLFHSNLEEAVTQACAFTSASSEAVLASTRAAKIGVSRAA